MLKLQNWVSILIFKALTMIDISTDTDRTNGSEEGLDQYMFVASPEDDG